MATWENLSSAELNGFQRARLHRHVLEQIYPFSPYYQEKFNSLKLRPARVTGLASLDPIGLTSLRPGLEGANGPDVAAADFALKPDPARIRKSASSGFKWSLLWRRFALGGQEADSDLRLEYDPVGVCRTAPGPESGRDIFFSRYDMDLFGGIIGERFFTVLDLPKGSRILHLAGEPAGGSHVALGIGATIAGHLLKRVPAGEVPTSAARYRLLREFKPDALFCSGAMIYSLLREARNHEFDWGSLSRIALDARDTDAEKMKAVQAFYQREHSKEAPALRYFGLPEAKSFFAECPGGSKSGLHLYADAGIMECFDPRDGKPVGEGAAGELVYTSLEGRGSSFLRARTGWRCSGGLSYEKCPCCKRRLPRILGDLHPVERAEGFRRVHNAFYSGGDLFAPARAAAPKGAEFALKLSKFENDPLSLDQAELTVSAPGVDPREAAGAIALSYFNILGWSPEKIVFADTIKGGPDAIEDKRFQGRPQ